MAEATEVKKQTQYITFYISDEEYAVNLLKVREIIEYRFVTRVPMMPVFLRGVINLRGSVVPVVDLALKFNLKEKPVTKRSCIIILEVSYGEGELVMGIVVDVVSEVIKLDDDLIEPPPEFGTKVSKDFLEGMGKVGEKIIMILNADKILLGAEVKTISKLRGKENPGLPEKSEGEESSPDSTKKD